jgi:hypothetical protein
MTLPCGVRVAHGRLQILDIQLQGLLSFFDSSQSFLGSSAAAG